MTLARTRVLTPLLWLAALTLWAGCGKNGPATVPVTGVVTLDGSPVAEAGVMFAGPEGGSPMSAVTDAQGQFHLNALVGVNLVAVSKTKQVGGAAAKPAGDEPMLMPASAVPTVEPQWIVPKKYADARNSGLKVDVKRGMGPVKLDLLSK